MNPVSVLDAMLDQRLEALSKRVAERLEQLMPSLQLVPTSALPAFYQAVKSRLSRTPAWIDDVLLLPDPLLVLVPRWGDTTIRVGKTWRTRAYELRHRGYLRVHLGAPLLPQLEAWFEEFEGYVFELLETAEKEVERWTRVPV